jgi:hypothetical protein
MRSPMHIHRFSMHEKNKIGEMPVLGLIVNRVYPDH